MHAYWYWLIVAFVLVIAEMLSGTFYLLVLGMAAFVAGLVAYLDHPLALQAAAATAVGALGVLAVSRHRRASAAPGDSNNVDVGQAVTFVSWLDEGQGLARVKYRDTFWDARVIGERRAQTYYILRTQGNLLHVSPTPP
ncbi:MAG: NfeD family protein [Rhodospirillaceae bacterium]